MTSLPHRSHHDRGCSDAPGIFLLTFFTLKNKQEIHFSTASTRVIFTQSYTGNEHKIKRQGCFCGIYLKVNCVKHCWTKRMEHDLKTHSLHLPVLVKNGAFTWSWELKNADERLLKSKQQLRNSGESELPNILC